MMTGSPANASRRSPLTPIGTRIVATLGPSCSSPEVLAEMFETGVDVLRFNFSHDSPEQRDQVLRAVRGQLQNRPRALALLGDLCGPKIRLLKLEAGEAELPSGARIIIQRDAVLGTAERVATNNPDMIDDVEVGHRLLIDDGAIRLRVASKSSDELVCVCEVGGVLKSRKGINFPDTNLRVATLTEKDLADLEWAFQAELDYLALSFVRSAADIAELRRRISDAGADIQIVAKIETPQALANIEAIIEASDAIMIARGDLGVEVDLERVPLIQKDLTDRCRRAGKPVIVATQMLQSMVDSPVPTRAEVSDVANAILDCADAVMLSAETAVGKHPARAIRTLHQVADQTEAFDQEHYRPVAVNEGCSGVTASVARGIAAIAEQAGARAIALWTERGALARLVSKHRIDLPVIALTDCPATMRRMALYFNIQAFLADRPDDLEDCIRKAAQILLDSGHVDEGDLVVVGFGMRTLHVDSTASISLHRVGRRTRA